MVAEFGHFALALALCVALVQGIVPLYGAARGDGVLMAVARPAALALCGLLALSFGTLVYAFVTSDFSVSNVAQNSHSAKPLFYKIAGSWGNHEGSMLLWCFILALFGGLVAWFGQGTPPGLKSRTLAVQGLLAACFIAFVLFTSNPFLRLDPAPLDGNDLNPLLQDPALVLHPPMLYLGYVGLSVSFSFAIAALLEGRVDPSWARWVRPWTLAAWLFLTAGIALGSWWAYYELGWGGWWYWDPVENASFMPWLLATALLHSAIVVEKREALKKWTVLLAILAFGLSMVGTFLVRSGVITSVHAFALDPARGVFILGLIFVVLGLSLALYSWRAPSLDAKGLFAPVSREGALVLNNLLLATAAATVFLGTLYPLILEGVGGPKVSVGPQFFNATFLPLMAPCIAVMAFGPLLSWKRGDLPGVTQRLTVAFLAAVAAFAITWMVKPEGDQLPLGILTVPVGAIGMAFAVWLGLGTLTEWAERVRLFKVPAAESFGRARGLPRAAYGMLAAHFGMAVAIAGMTGAGLWKEESIVVMRPGQTVEAAGYALTLLGVREEKGSTFTATRAEMRVERDGQLVTTLLPAKRFYEVQQMPTTESAIHTTGMDDLYVVMGDPHKEGDRIVAWTVTITLHPLVPWIWAGATLMVLGGLISLTDRRLRVGAPHRRNRSAAGGAMPALAAARAPER